MRKTVSTSSASWSDWESYVTESELTDKLSKHVAINSLQLGGKNASEYALVKEKVSIIYVSSDTSIGDDTNTGSEITHPKATIKSAVESVDEGTRAEIILLPTSGHEEFAISEQIISNNTHIVIHASGAKVEVTNTGGFTMYGGYLWLLDGTYNVHVTPFIRAYEDARVNISSNSTITIKMFVNNFRLLYSRSSKGSSIGYLTSNNLTFGYDTDRNVFWRKGM